MTSQSKVKHTLPTSRDHDHTEAGKVHQKEKVPKSTSPLGERNQPSCFSYLKGEYTKLSCAGWHPSDCVKYKTNEGCKVGVNVRFFIQTQQRSTMQRVVKGLDI